MKPNLTEIYIATTLAVLVGGLSTQASAQSKKPAPTRPAVATTGAAQTARPKGPIVLGTTQLPGDFGQIGQTYTLGQREPINFTLKSAEYAVTPFVVDNNTWVPKADEKLLILHYTVHNPIP